MKDVLQENIEVVYPVSACRPRHFFSGNKNPYGADVLNVVLGDKTDRLLYSGSWQNENYPSLVGQLVVTDTTKVAIEIYQDHCNNIIYIAKQIRLRGENE